MNLKPKKEQPLNEKDYENYQKYEEAKTKYKELYHDYKKKNKAPIAISAFSKNVEELGKIRPKLISRIRIHVDGIIKFVSIKANQDEEIKKASQLVKLSLSQTFSVMGIEYMSFVEIDYVYKETLQKELREYCELVGGDALKRHPELQAEIEIAYREREKLENVSIHKNALEILIKDILIQGYPDKIEEENSEDSQSEGVSRGRPRKEAAPLDKIKVHVLLLAKKALNEEPGFKNYWHFNDRYGWGPNKKRMKDNLFKEGIVSGVDDSTVIRRIEEAFDDASL